MGKSEGGARALRAREAGAAEIGALTELARMLQRHAPHVASAIVPCLSQPFSETAEDAQQLFIQLRRIWLQASHDAAHVHLRSPCSSDAAYLPSGRPVEFGYERELTPEHLEARAGHYAPPPPGWKADQLLFSSGQAALSAVVLQATAKAAGRAVCVAHIGSYFETTELLKLFAADVVEADEDSPHLGGVDLLILEPVHLRERFHCLDIGRLRRTFERQGVPPMIAVDATLSHLRFETAHLTDLLPAGSACQAMRIGSLLKLDQAGFELANAGLLSVYQAANADTASADLVQRLARTRAVTGTGLGFADVCALDVPWLFDAAFARRYAGAVFANNQMLARALSSKVPTPVFTHPAADCPDSPWSVAPFCVLRLPEPNVVARRIAERAADQGLALQQGGSFGFRTHRFDVVEPEGQPPFLRIAMGASALSRDESIALVCEEASAATGG